MKNTNIDDPVVGLTVSLEALKDKHYKKYKHLTKRQLTDLLYELEAENTGLGVKLNIYETLSAGLSTDPWAKFFSKVKL